MKVVIQRCKKSSVKYHNTEKTITSGLVVLVGFTNGDNATTIDYVVNKMLNLRIFDDEFGIMNKSLLDVDGEVLSISQFTLYANTEKGRRPSYIDALEPGVASELYNIFNKKLKEKVKKVATGLFGEEMLVTITNDGPVTIIIER